MPTCSVDTEPRWNVRIPTTEGFARDVAEVWEVGIEDGRTVPDFARLGWDVTVCPRQSGVMAYADNPNVGGFGFMFESVNRYGWDYSGVVDAFWLVVGEELHQVHAVKADGGTIVLETCPDHLDAVLSALEEAVGDD